MSYQYVVGESYEAGVTVDWEQGVLDHVRSVRTAIDCKKGRNTIRFYGTDMENVLEKIIVLREGKDLPAAYLL